MQMNVDDEILALLLLCLLLDSWEKLVVSLNNSVSKLTKDIIRDSLLNEEAKRIKKGECSSFSKAYAGEKRAEEGEDFELLMYIFLASDSLHPLQISNRRISNHLNKMENFPALYEFRRSSNRSGSQRVVAS